MPYTMDFLSVNQSHMMNIIYNILNLPQRHTVGGGLMTVDYMYAADGRKVQEKVTSGTSVTIRDYVESSYTRVVS